MSITDEDLTAYLDGALAADEAARIKAAVLASPELSSRLEALDAPVEDVRKAFDQLLDVAPAVVLPDPVPSSRLPWFAAVAAAAVLGLGLGGLLFRQSPADWTDVVANYQSLYVSETLSPPPMSPEQQRMVVAGLSAQLGVDLSPLIGLDAIEFRRAQMLGIEGAPLVQMAYLADGSVPLAICVTIVSGNDSAIKVSRMYGMEAASWTEDGFGYLVIGGDDATLIRQLAETARSSI